MAFPPGEQQTGLYRGKFPQLAFLPSRATWESECKSSSHHQGAPKNSNCLHNRLKGTTEREENYPEGEKIGNWIHLGP